MAKDSNDEPASARGSSADGRRRAAGGRRKPRKPVTIDLTADDVSSAQEPPSRGRRGEEPNEDPAGARSGDRPEPETADQSGPTEARQRSADAARVGTEPTAASDKAEVAGGPSGAGGGGAAARPSQASPREPPRPYLVIGLVGAAVVFAILALFAGARLFGDSSGPAVEALATEVDALRAELEAMGGTTSEQLAARDETITALRQTVDELAALPPPGAPPEFQVLEARMSEAEERLAALGARIDDEVPVLRLEGLASRLDALEEVVATGGGNAEDTALAALAARVDRLEETTPADGGGGPAAGVRSKLDAVEAGVDAVEARVVALEGRDPPDLGPVSDAVAALRSDLAATSGRIAGLDQNERIEALAAAVRGAESRAERAAADVAGVAPAIAALSLADALAAGRPFTAELQAVRRHGAGDTELQAIAPYAETGLPTLSELVASFERLKPSLLDGEVEPEEEAGTLDRLIRSARDLVEVRPTGPLAGEDSFAVASRISASLAAGDLAAALAEREGLPPEQKALTSEWAERASARVSGDRLAERMRNAAVTRLAGGDGP